VPVTNGELVQELVKRTLVKHTQINKTGISGDQGDGHQPYGFAAKQLLNAEGTVRGNGLEAGRAVS
jgi:hypothetical protein